jgi:hypothetical protein
MKTLGTAVVGRGIGGSEMMFNAMFCTPVHHRFGNQFAVIGDKDL